MAQTTNAPAPPRLAAPRRAQALEAVRNAAGQWDAEAFHIMDERDNALIEQELLHGSGSSKFVYDFNLAGTQVSGISVVGARHLATFYGGIKHRLVASVQKTTELFVFTSYPANGMPMQVSCSVIAELADQPDFYGVVVEVSDIKTGNTIQIERRENRFERKRDGTYYERPHYATIAQSKAYRNGVLDLIPQDIQIRWKLQQLQLGKNETITASIIDEKRAGVLRFAASKAIPLDRRAIEHLTIDQLSGLGDAVREGQIPAFVNAARALGLDFTDASTDDGEGTAATETTATTAGNAAADATDARTEAKGDGPASDAGNADTAPQAQETRAEATSDTGAQPEGETAGAGSGAAAPQKDLF